MGPRACLDAAEKRKTLSLSGIEPQSLSRAVCSLQGNSDKYKNHVAILFYLCVGATVIVRSTDLKPMNYNLPETMRELTSIGK